MRKTLPIEGIQKLPKSPGIYFLKNKHGDIFYIGKASNIHSRIKSHLRSGKIIEADSHKVTIDFIEYIKTKNEIEALLLESEYIKKVQPKLNIRLRDDKKYFYVGITKEDLPRVFITHQPVAKGGKLQLTKKGQSEKTKTKIEYLGPFTDGKALRTTMKYLSRSFPYYWTSLKFPLQTRRHSALPCPKCHLGLCPGPNPDKNMYKKNIRSLKSILSGRGKNVLISLKKEMKKASLGKNYENAAKIRDIIEALNNVFSHREFLFFNNPNIEKNHKQTGEYLSTLLKISSKIESIEGYDISNIGGKEPTASMIRFENEKPNKNLYKKFNINSPETPNDYLMMAEVIRRRFKHSEWSFPDLILIDGGRGQLNAVLAELRLLNIVIPAVSLAKKEEELYIPNKNKPILLKNMPQNVENLLRHVRDEAHRFAISHHRNRHRKQFQ